MPTQPDHTSAAAGAARTSTGQDRTIRPGRTAAGDRPAAAGGPVPYVGIGVNAAAAWAPYLTTIKGVTIAVIGVSQIAELASSWVATVTRPGEANAIDLGRTLAACGRPNGRPAS